MMWTIGITIQLFFTLTSYGPMRSQLLVNAFTCNNISVPMHNACSRKIISDREGVLYVKSQKNVTCLCDLQPLFRQNTLVNIWTATSAKPRQCNINLWMYRIAPHRGPDRCPDFQRPVRYPLNTANPVTLRIDVRSAIPVHYCIRYMFDAAVKGKVKIQCRKKIQKSTQKSTATTTTLRLMTSSLAISNSTHESNIRILSKISTSTPTSTRSTQDLLDTTSNGKQTSHFLKTYSSSSIKDGYNTSSSKVQKPIVFHQTKANNGLTEKYNKKGVISDKYKLRIRPKNVASSLNSLSVVKGITTLEQRDVTRTFNTTFKVAYDYTKNLSGLRESMSKHFTNPFHQIQSVKYSTPLSDSANKEMPDKHELSKSLVNNKKDNKVLSPASNDHKTKTNRTGRNLNPIKNDKLPFYQSLAFIIGITVASVVLIPPIILIIFIFCRRRGKHRKGSNVADSKKYSTTEISQSGSEFSAYRGKNPRGPTSSDVKSERREELELLRKERFNRSSNDYKFDNCL